MLSDFRNSIAFWKVPRLCPFFLLVRATFRTMCIEHWCNDKARGIPVSAQKNLSQCLLVHHKPHVDWPKILKSNFHTINPYPTAFPYGNGMVLHFYQQQESSTTKTVHKVINKGLKTYV